MKRLSLLGFGLLASLLAGCPIFSGDGQGSSSVCATRDCSADCTITGCPSGFACIVDPNTASAVCESTTGEGGGSTNPTTSSTTSTGTGGSTMTGTGGSTTSMTSSSSTMGGTGGSTTTPVYCGHPSDCPSGQICSSNGTCQPGPCSATNACIFGYTCGSDGTCKGGANACNSDADCSNGDLCIAGSDGKGGVCTPQANQCFDQSQCGANEKCVNGKCELGCTSDMDCGKGSGLTCNTTTGVCSGVVKTCTVTSDCGSASEVCVGGACVPRSNGSTCPTGDVWDENGCIPNQAASFICQTDGMSGGCATGSICLHHVCWISCDPTTMAPCNASGSQFPQCKPVVDGSQTYNVCGSSTNLGTDCGPNGNNKTCSGGKVCVDGFCK